MSGFGKRSTFLLRCFWILLLLQGVLSIGLRQLPEGPGLGQDGGPPLTKDMGTPSRPSDSKSGRSSSTSQSSSAPSSSNSTISPTDTSSHHTETDTGGSLSTNLTSAQSQTSTAIPSTSTTSGAPNDSTTTMASDSSESPTATSAAPSDTDPFNTSPSTAPPSASLTPQSSDTPPSTLKNLASKSNKTTAIAAGVTAPVVLIALAAGGILFYRRRQRARDRREWERTHEEIADAVRQVGAGGSGSAAASGVTRGSSRSAWSRMELMPREPSLSEEPALPVGMMAASTAGSDAHAAYAFPYADSADGHFVNTAGVGAGGASVQRAGTNPFRRTAGTNPFLDRAPFSDYVYPKSVSPPPPGAGYDPAAQAAWSHQQQNAPEPAFYSDEPGSRPASSMGGASAAHADTPYGSQSHAR